VGLKAGLTSHAKMKQMGVETPCFGFLADYFAVPEGGECKVSQLIHPKVEPEIAFITKRALKGPGCHIGAVLAATDFVMPGMEVIDSRYRDFKFDLKSVVADNTSAVRFVLGHPAAAIAMLANHLGARGEEIPAGSIILSGGITEAVAVQAGDSVCLRVQGMGSVGMRFV
jgi:2-oxo-3-hexenedioate decarboxylase